MTIHLPSTFTFFVVFQFSVRIQIVSGISGHAATMAACINAVSLALLQTAIPLTASIVAVCSSEVDANCRRMLINSNRF